MFISLCTLSCSLKFANKKTLLPLRRFALSATEQVDLPPPPLSTAPISIISAAGALEMSYITYNKFMDIPNFCLSQSDSCNSILNSPFSVIPFTSIPLSFIGFVAYLTVFFLTSSEFAFGSKKDVFVLMITSSMATFSLYLMFVLQMVLHASCPYCYLSAALSLSLAALAWSKRIVPNKTTAVVVSSSSVAVTAMASAFMFYVTSSFLSPDAASASTAPAAQYLATEAAQNEPKAPPAITTTSSNKALALASRIESLQGKMYGAYWCSHCYNQKQEFGREAFEKIEYLECDKKGAYSKNSICKAKKIPGYPTWELNGEYFPGEKTLDELAALVSEVESAKAAQK